MKQRQWDKPWALTELHLGVWGTLGDIQMWSGRMSNIKKIPNLLFLLVSFSAFFSYSIHCVQYTHGCLQYVYKVTYYYYYFTFYVYKVTLIFYFCQSFSIFLLHSWARCNVMLFCCALVLCIVWMTIKLNLNHTASLIGL